MTRIETRDPTSTSSRCKTVFLTDVRGFPCQFFLESKIIMYDTPVFDQRTGYSRFVEEDPLYSTIYIYY